MGFVTVYQEPQYRNYKTTGFSPAILFQLLLFVIVLGVPIVLVAVDPDSWPLYTTFYEQPVVHYQQTALLNLALQDGSSISWSTIPAYNRLQGATFRPALLRTKTEDDNSDRIAERLLVSVDVPLQAQEQVVAVTLVVFFSFALQKRAFLEMTNQATVHEASPSFGSQLLTEGNLRLVQRVALPQAAVDQTLVIPLVNLSAASLDDFAVRDLFRRNARQNVSTAVDVLSSLWITGPGFTESFHIEATLHIPVMPVWLQTTILHRLSTAGSLFMFWLIPLWAASWLLRRYAFSTGLIPVVRNTDKYSVKMYFTKLKEM